MKKVTKGIIAVAGVAGGLLQVPAVQTAVVNALGPLVSHHPGAFGIVAALITAALAAHEPKKQPAE